MCLLVFGTQAHAGMPRQDKAQMPKRLEKAAMETFSSVNLLKHDAYRVVLPNLFQAKNRIVIKTRPIHSAPGPSYCSALFPHQTVRKSR